jgi:hypothetical protein
MSQDSLIPVVMALPTPGIAADPTSTTRSSATSVGHINCKSESTKSVTFFHAFRTGKSLALLRILPVSISDLMKKSAAKVISGSSHLQ